MRRYPKFIIVMILVFVGAGCRRLDTIPPSASVAITVTPTSKSSSAAGLTTTPALPSQASDTPTSDAESETESLRVEFEGISVLFKFDQPKGERQTSGRLDDLRLQISRYGQLAYQYPAARFGVPPGYLVNYPLSIVNPPQFYNLDEDTELEIVLEVLENGTHCCAHTIIGDYTPNETDPYSQYVFTWNTWGPSRNTPRFLDLGEDGKKEIISHNEQFSSNFGPFAISKAAPIQIWRYTPDGLRDVTGNFPESIRQDASRWWNSYINEESDLFGHSAALSAYVADQCMLEYAIGEEEIDWNQAEEIYDDSTQGVTKSWQDYLMQLLSALDANWYTCQEIFPPLSVPTASPQPTRLPLVPISFDPVSFSYDPSLASEIIAESILADPNVPDYFKLPNHLLITIDGDTRCNSSAWIHIIPVDEYIQINPEVEMTLTDLRNLLNLKPAALPPGEKIPYLPHLNAAQVIQAGISYFDFQNGSGVRSLLYYTQNLTLADVCSFQYTFQGLTHDGRYFISAWIPIFIPVLDENSVKGKYFFNDVNTFRQYLEALVNAQPAESFSPDLSLLDDMMRSLLVE